MEPSFSLLAILNLLGAAQGLLLALALLTIKRGNREANRILAGFAIAAALVISGGVLLTTRYILRLPHLDRLHDPFLFLIGPLLYFYLRAITSSESSFHKKDWLHVVPFFLCVGGLLPYFFQSGEYKLSQLIPAFQQNTPTDWFYVKSGLAILQSIAYTALIIPMLVRYSRRIKGQNLPTEQAVLSQVRFLVVSFVLILAAGIVRTLFDPTRNSNLLLTLGASVIVYVLGYMALRRPEILNAGDAPPAAKKYDKSTLSQEKSERYLRKLLHLMETEKPYTDGDLTIQKLAERLSVPVNHLSQIINERLNQNFVDFINGLRVEEAKRRLADPSKKHYSILAIAEEVGFKSKSTFNAVFKKHAKMTPSDFRNSCNGTTSHFTG
jgi:AraC-like DNA-binding protein